VALQNQRLMECLAGKTLPLALLPLELFINTKMLGENFWADQLTKHLINNTNE